MVALIEARPGAGKTTAIRRLAELLRDRGVALDELERLALPALEAPADVVLIDELGKMELASPAFVEAVEGLLDGQAPVVATVHAYRHPFTDRVKGRPDAEVVRLTRENRDELPRMLAKRLAPSQR